MIEIPGIGIFDNSLSMHEQDPLVINYCNEVMKLSSVDEVEFCGINGDQESVSRPLKKVWEANGIKLIEQSVYKHSPTHHEAFLLSSITYKMEAI